MKTLLAIYLSSFLYSVFSDDTITGTHGDAEVLYVGLFFAGLSLLCIWLLSKYKKG
jgi:hypothetical protein